MISLCKLLPCKCKSNSLAMKQIAVRLKVVEAMVVNVLKGQIKLMATMNQVTDAISQLGVDVADQIQAAKDAILRAQAGDPEALDAVVASLNVIDTAVKEATEAFKNTNV